MSGDFRGLPRRFDKWRDVIERQARTRFRVRPPPRDLPRHADGIVLSHRCDRCNKGRQGTARDDNRTAVIVVVAHPRVGNERQDINGQYDG
ncbi:MAG: hypothetical protein LBD64_02200 [Odoribacteraceae bacterium]|nr:hypothetical protein [Odoribacteraceae bacterium]